MTRRAAALLFACMLLALFLLRPASGAEGEIVRVGKETITEEDVLFQISSRVADDGDGLRTAMALVQMDDRAKIELVNQLADELLFAQEALRMGLHKEPDTARMLRWQEVRTLAGVYLADASRKWDQSEAAAKKYYETHLDEFVDAQAVKMRYLLLPEELTRTLSGDVPPAGTTLADYAKRHNLPTDAESMTESAWMESGLVRPEFQAVFFSNETIGLLPPIAAGSAHYLVEITARRKPRQLSWEEASAEAFQRLHRHLLKTETERLRTANPVKLNEAALSNLGKLQTEN